MSISLQVILVVSTIIKLYLLGKKNKLGWLFCIGAEASWLICAIFIWKQWGAIALSPIYIIGSLWAYWKWKTPDSVIVEVHHNGQVVANPSHQGRT